jgi:hypothetical protein
MKKSELKKILRPLVSECIKESLMEDGLISEIIAEVVRGMTASSPRPPTNIATAQDTQSASPVDRRAEQAKKLQEHRSKLMSAIGKEAYNGVNLFEGTSPAPAQAPSTHAASPLSGQAPNDAGVDISNLFKSSAPHWNAHMSDLGEKERK